MVDHPTRFRMQVTCAWPEMMMHYTLTPDDKDYVTQLTDEVRHKLNPRGRSREEHHDQTYKGFLGELAYHATKGTLAWWKARNEEIRASKARTDGGTDTPDGRNVKTVWRGERCVYLHGDTSAETYMLVELDQRGRTTVARVVGEASKAKARPIEVGTPREGYGFMVEDFEP